MQVRLIAKTTGFIGTEYEEKSLDEITVGIARLSSSRDINELFDEPHKLLRHCLLNGHWSVFSTTNLVFEIITSRAMGRELLRHWSIRPQEISQRYAEITEFEEVEIRKQCKNNRQSSTELIVDTWDFSPNQQVKYHIRKSENLYREMLENGIAKECARMILPETTQTKLIMNGTLREWITTLNQRLHNTAQKECRLIAESIRDIFIDQCPVISAALYNFEYAEQIHILDRLTLEKFGVFNLIKDNNFKSLKKNK